jgi:hypothetical protein
MGFLVNTGAVQIIAQPAEKRSFWTTMTGDFSEEVVRGV